MAEFEIRKIDLICGVTGGKNTITFDKNPKRKVTLICASTMPKPDPEELGEMIKSGQIVSVLGLDENTGIIDIKKTENEYGDVLLELRCSKCSLRYSYNFEK